YIPHFVSYMLCFLWERYSTWSERQLSPAFNTYRWHAQWKKTYYSNNKLKALVGWAPRIQPTEALRRYFESCRDGGQHVWGRHCGLRQDRGRPRGEDPKN